MSCLQVPSKPLCSPVMWYQLVALPWKQRLRSTHYTYLGGLFSSFVKLPCILSTPKPPFFKNRRFLNLVCQTAVYILNTKNNFFQNWRFIHFARETYLNTQKTLFRKVRGLSISFVKLPAICSTLKVNFSKSKRLFILFVKLPCIFSTPQTPKYIFGKKISWIPKKHSSGCVRDRRSVPEPRRNRRKRSGSLVRVMNAGMRGVIYSPVGDS